MGRFGKAAGAVVSVSAATEGVMGRSELASFVEEGSGQSLHIAGSWPLVRLDPLGEAAVGEGEGRSSVRTQASGLGDRLVGCGNGRSILTSGVSVAGSCLRCTEGLTLMAACFAWVTTNS